jgi:hypothetical protein
VCRSCGDRYHQIALGDDVRQAAGDRRRDRVAAVIADVIADASADHLDVSESDVVALCS